MADWDQRKKQFLMVGGAVMVSVGFMFGIAVNLSGMAPSAPGGNEPADIEAEMPESNYNTEGTLLSYQEQAVLAFENQAVFLTVIYEDERPEIEFLEGLPETFGNRVYVSYEESSESRVVNDIPVQEFPGAIVVGDQPTEQGAYADRPQLEEEEVIQSICTAMNDNNEFAALCF